MKFVKRSTGSKFIKGSTGSKFIKGTVGVATLPSALAATAQQVMRS